MLPAAVSIALISLLAGFVEAHFRAQRDSPLPPALAFQPGKAAPSLQPASQVTTSPAPAKNDPPFPEPVETSRTSPARRLWVVNDHREVVEYDPTNFAPQPSVKIPADAIPSDQHGIRYSLDINRKGQILVGPVTHGNSIENGACTLWLWNGQAGSYLNCGNQHRDETAPDGTPLTTDILSSTGLSADGEHLFWFVNEQRENPGEPQKDIMPSLATTFHIWETNLSGGQRQEIDSISVPECICTTGACEETCPTFGAWAPRGGVDNFFQVSGSYTGQVNQTRYVGESLYRKSPDGHWSSSKLPSSFEEAIVDVADDASAFVILIPDSACCGWNNESDDQTLLLRKGQTIVLFDEFARYHNQQYDVSYSASEAQLSPDNKLVAMTISSSAREEKNFAPPITFPETLTLPTPPAKSNSAQPWPIALTKLWLICPQSRWSLQPIRPNVLPTCPMRLLWDG